MERNTMHDAISKMIQKNYTGKDRMERIAELRTKLELKNIII